MKLSEKTKVRLWNGGVLCFILFCLFMATQVGPMHRRACESVNKQMWRSYSGFYNKGYETGYQDAKAGRDPAPEITGENLRSRVIPDPEQEGP